MNGAQLLIYASDRGWRIGETTEGRDQLLVLGLRNGERTVVVSLVPNGEGPGAPGLGVRPTAARESRCAVVLLVREIFRDSSGE